jgi:glycosyltransferase involved in cell wall biosynthesis
VSAGRPRALHVANTLDPASGGTATAAVMVALAARRAGIAVTLVAPLDPARATAAAPFVARLTAAGVEVRTFPVDRWAGRRGAVWGVSRGLARALPGLVASHDLVHAHSVWVASTIAAVRAARAGGRPVVVMPHEGLTRYDMGHATNPVLKWLKRPIRRWYLARVDGFLMVSDLELRDSLLADDPRAVSVALPACDERDPAPERPPREPGGLTVGFLGRFHPKKNLALVIKALARCPAEVRLVVAGGGDSAAQAAMRDLATARGVAERVTWLGFVDEAGRRRFLTEIHLLAVPSVFECFGLVATEALAAGTPVLVSPTVGMAELAEDAGAALVVPPRADALAAAFARLAADPGELAALTAAARPAALAHFTLAAHGAALAAVYARVLVD